MTDALVRRMPESTPNEAFDEMTGQNMADRISIPISYALTELLNNAMSHARRMHHADARVWVAEPVLPQQWPATVGRGG